MPDQFYVAPPGQIPRNPADSSPDRPVIVPASRIDLTAAEEASILARAATDPVRVALLAAIAGTAAGSARVDPTTGTATIVTATAAGAQVQSPVSGGGVVDVTAADVNNDVAPTSPGTYPDTLTQYLVPAGGGPAPGFKLVWIAPESASLPALRGWRYSFAPSETVI